MHSPPYPSAIYSIHALDCNLQCAGQQWAGRRTNGFTSIYKFVYTGSMKREGNRNYPNGDLTEDVSTRSSTYIKTFANKEKFPY